MKLHPDNAAQVIALYQREIDELRAERDELMEIIDGCHICTAALAHAAGKRE